MKQADPKPEEIRRRSRAAFARLWHSWNRDVYRFVRSSVRSREDANDLVQMTFARALSECGSYRGGSPKSWLFKIAANLVHDAHRQNAADRTVPEEAVDPGNLPQVLVYGGNRAGLHPIDAGVLLRETLERLPAVQQEMIRYRWLAQFTHAEIGKMTGKTEVTVRQECNRLGRELKRIAREGPGAQETQK